MHLLKNFSVKFMRNCPDFNYVWGIICEDLTEGLILNGPHVNIKQKYFNTASALKSDEFIGYLNGDLIEDFCLAHVIHRI